MNIADVVSDRCSGSLRNMQVRKLSGIFRAYFWMPVKRQNLAVAFVVETIHIGARHNLPPNYDSLLYVEVLSERNVQNLAARCYHFKSSQGRYKQRVWNVFGWTQNIPSEAAYRLPERFEIRFDSFSGIFSGQL